MLECCGVDEHEIDQSMSTESFIEHTGRSLFGLFYLIFNILLIRQHMEKNIEN